MSRTLARLGILCLTTQASAETVCYDSGPGVLPDDALIPAEHRFTLSGDTSFVSVGATLRVTDDVWANSVHYQKVDHPPVTSADDWEFETWLQMHSADRNSGLLDIGNWTTVRDDQKQISLGWEVGRVGFTNLGSTAFVNGLSVAMDTTDQFHHYLVRKTGPTIELFVDGAATAALTISHSDFPDTPGTEAIWMASTSLAGVSDFEVANYTFRRNTYVLDLAACPPLLDAGDILTLSSRYAVPGSVNLLYVVAVNGSPFIAQVLTSSADGDGEWSQGAVIPPGLSGLSLTLLQFGYTQGSGQLAASNTSTIAFR